MEFLLFVAGLFLGIASTGLFYVIKSCSGVLKIDHSDPEKDVYRFEIDDLSDLKNKNRIELKIDHNADLSQE